MIGSALKKYAKENSLNVSHGVAYGDFRGFAATLSEGSGYKLIVVATKFASTEQLNEFLTDVNQKNLEKEFRVRLMRVTDEAIVIEFNDTVGTMKKIRSFCDYFFPLLAKHEALGADRCFECGCEFTGNGSWKLINGVAYHMHESCANSKDTAAKEAQQQALDEDNGSYLSGAVGALIGALIGAIPWALVMYSGYVAAILGLLIGWLAHKGYNLLHGKKTKIKIPIVIIMSIIGVIAGTLGCEAFSLFTAIRDGLLPELTYGDIIPSLLYLLETDSEYLVSIGANLLQGLLFALLGTLGIIKEMKEETKGHKMVSLN